MIQYYSDYEEFMKNHSSRFLFTDYFDGFLTTKYLSNLSASYQENLEQVLSILSGQDRCIIVVFGPAGSGKSTLMSQLAASLSAAGAEYEEIKAYYEKKTEKHTEKGKTVLLIDGFDELQNKKVILADAMRLGYPKIVISLRTESVALWKDRLSDNTEQWTSLYFNQLLSNSYFSIHPNQVFFKNILPKDIPTTPLRFLLWKSFLERENDVKKIIQTYERFAQLIYEYGYGASFSKDFYIPKREIIVPKPEIISGITVVNDTLIHQAKRNPEIMYEFTPRQFEEMVCELFEKQGFHVKLTKQTHDGGKDLIVLQRDTLGEFCIYMDCKKYRPDRPVGVQLVRELYGTVEADRVTAGKIVTTSYFTEEAKEYTETVKYRMSLMDFDEIVRALEKV